MRLTAGATSVVHSRNRLGGMIAAFGQFGAQNASEPTGIKIKINSTRVQLRIRALGVTAAPHQPHAANAGGAQLDVPLALVGEDTESIVGGDQRQTVAITKLGTDHERGTRRLCLAQ